MVSGWIVLPMWYFEQGLRIKSVAATTRLGLDDAMQLFFSSAAVNREVECVGSWSCLRKNLHHVRWFEPAWCECCSESGLLGTAEIMRCCFKSSFCEWIRSVSACGQCCIYTRYPCGFLEHFYSPYFCQEYVFRQGMRGRVWYHCGP